MPNSLASGSSSLAIGQGIDPILLDIGLLTGLLQDSGGGSGAYSVNSNWFNNPIAATGVGVRQHAPQLTDLLIRLLGSIGGNALGVPAADPALLGTWIPIPNPDDVTKPTNFYVVSYSCVDDKNVPTGDTVFGFGVKVGWEKDLGATGATGTLHGPQGVKVEAWGLLPLLKIGPKDGVSVALENPGAPISVGIAIEGMGSGASAPILSAGTPPNALSFDGIRLSAEISLAPSPSVDVSLVVLNMVLPGQKAANRTLADLEALPASQIMQVASTLFVAALSDLSKGAADAAAFFLPLVGLSEYIPGIETKMPLLPWWDLAGLAIKGQNVAAPFIQWFTNLTASSDLSKAWLYSAAGLLGVKSLTANSITGNGTRTDPYQAPLIVGKPLPGTLYLSVASWVDEAGLRHFYPGLGFHADPITLGGTAVLAFDTTLELAEFKLYANKPAQYTGPSSLRLSTTVALLNADATKPLLDDTLGGDKYVFGRFQAGFMVDASGTIAPTCQLIGVESPGGNFDVIDLTSPGQLASTGQNELLSLVQSGLKELLGIGNGTDVPFAANVAALIGVIAPTGVKTWPAAAPQPPFAITNIGASMADPISAIATYYEALLSSTVDVNGQTPFYYVLQELASLFQETGGTITITGSGTAAAPWRASLSLASTALPAALTVYTTAPSAGITRLFLGLDLGPDLTLPGGFAFQPRLGMHFLSLDLPAPGSSATVSAEWLPDISVSLNLPTGFKTPTIAKSSFSVSSAALSASWSQHTSWDWSLVAKAPTFTIGGTKLPFAGDLNWGDQTSLQNLVLQTAANFSPVLVGVMGVALTSRSTRIGTTLTGVLGLLPDPSEVSNFPASLKPAWAASTLKPLAITALANPWPFICTKFANDLASPANGSAVLGLLGWALNPGLADAPAVAGTGAAGDPWRVPLAGTAFELVVSSSGGGPLIGLGLGRTDHVAPAASLAVAIQTTLSAVQFSTATGALVSQGDWPSLHFTATLTNPNGNLIEVGAAGSAAYLLVKSAVFGFNVILGAGGSLSFVPVVTLQGSIFPGQSTAKDYTFDQLANLASDAIQNYEAALNTVVQSVVTAITGPKDVSAAMALPSGIVSAFSTAYDVLSMMGLTLPVAPGTNTGYGINAGGWQALRADPLTFVEDQLLLLLSDPAKRSIFFQFISSTLGIQLPTVPLPALQTLVALGVLGDESLGYPLRPHALLQLAQDPFGTLKAQFESLYTDGQLSPAAEGLISALNQSLISTPFGKYFSFSAVQGHTIELAVGKPKKTDAALVIGEEGEEGEDTVTAFVIGDLLTIWGSVQLDLQKRSLSAQLDLYNPTVRLALQPSFSYTLGGSFRSGLEVVWGDGSLPAPESLVLWPFKQTEFLNQLSRLAPAYVLSTVVTQVLEGHVLKDYKLAQFIFQALGLATQDEAGAWHMPSLLGLLDDPKGWLLSTVVLGDKQGRFSLDSLQKALARIPAAEVAILNNKIGIKPWSGNGQTGVQIYGFPYGFGAVVSTDGSTTSQYILETSGLTVADGAATIEMLSAGLTLGPTFQPGIVGDLRVSGKVANYTLFAEAGYNDDFSFTVGQTNTATPLSLQLVPFMGWGSLVEQAVRLAAATLLDTLVPKLFEALKAQNSAKLTDFVTRLEKAGGALKVGDLVSGITAIPVGNLSLQSVEKVVVSWLLDRFKTGNATATAQAIVDMLDNVLPGTIAVGTGGDAELAVYTPSKDVPVTVYVGVSQDNNLGIWAGVGLPEMSLLKATIQRTGVGFPVANLASNPQPVFQFGVDLQVPVEKTTDDSGPCFGPWLSLNFDAKTSRFVGSFDPLYNSASKTPASPLKIELLPNCTLSTKEALEKWLLGVVTTVLPRYVSAIVLNTSAIKAWLDTPIISGQPASPTAALLLLGSHLIINDGTAKEPVYVLTPFSELKNLTVEKFLGGLLYALMQNEIKVLSWGEDKTAGGLWIGPEKGSPDTLGVRVAAPGMKLSSVPNLTIELGAADDEWITKSSTTAPEFDPGLAFYVPNNQPGQDYRPDFTSAILNLVNVGLDFTGKDGRPLVDKPRFQLGGISPRVLFSLAFNKGKLAQGSPLFGGAMRFDSIAISLAPNQVTGSNNPVAQNLLGTGGDSDGTDSDTKNPPANPAFSVEAAYLDKLYVALLDADGNQAAKIWFPVQRGFGPLYVNKFGVGWEGDKAPPLFDLLFDGSVALAGFKLDLMGLNVGVPVSSDITDFSKYHLELAGFDLTYKGGPVSLTAEFLKTEVDNTIEYSGLAILKVSQFSIMAVGSYAAVPTEPGNPDSPTATSLFVFGALNAPLGGIPAFFITGVAAGFSYNRGLILPAINEVSTFPLVQGVVEGSFSSSSPDGAKSALATLSKSVYPEIGQYWVAAGLKFTSFRMIDGFGLIFIQFGRTFEIALLGVASMALPKAVARSNALAYVELALKAVINPTVGFLSVEAQLTPNSFVLAQECKLTGGFAFYLWFKSQTQNGKSISGGDFVLTLGGYAPAFQKPDHYPDVPRLGFNWPINIGVGSLSVGGGAYFALTPSSVMAGGYLKATFEMGPIKAWFDAQANFYIAWAPFYFEVDIGVEVGVSFGTTIAGVSVTLSASLGATLHLEGPPTAGEVEINWFVVSFTIPFGSGKKPSTATLNWAEFEGQFLPERSDAAAPPPQATPMVAMLAAAAPVTASTTGGQQQVLKLSVENGLVNAAEDNSLWTLQSEPFVLRFDSAIPINFVTVDNPHAPTFTGPTVGLQPANKSSINTPLTLSITHTNSGSKVDMNISPLRFDTQSDGSPNAAWGKSVFNPGQTPSGSDMMIDGTVKSVRIIADQCLSTSVVGPFPVERLKYTKNDTVTLPFASQLPFNTTTVYKPSAAIPGQDQALATMMKTIMDPVVAALRDQVFQALAQRGIAVVSSPNLSVMSASADMVVQSPPVLAHLGVYLASAPEAPKVVASRAFTMASVLVMEESVQVRRHSLAPQMKGVMRRHRQGTASSQRWSETIQRRSTTMVQATFAVSAPAKSLVQQGTITLWEGAFAGLHYDGKLPARFACFNDNDELVADIHDHRGNVSLPSGVAALSAHGLEPETTNLTTAGWTVNDEVLRVNSRYFVGDGFSLRPQGFAAIRRNRRPLLKGMVDIAAVQESNQITGGRQGGIETFFAGWMRTAAVVVPDGVQGSDITVSVDYVANPANARDPDRLKPVATLKLEDRIVYFYTTGEEPLGDDALFTVFASSLVPGVKILGVSASIADPSVWKDSMQNPVLEAAAALGVPEASFNTVRSHGTLTFSTSL